MPDLKFNPLSWPPASSRQSNALGHARTLQAANRQALRHLGLPIESTGDPKGRVLRQLRLHQCIDPAWLATEACMSLSQLYELEDGSKSRFYSDSLRRQAGRRVAHLLGTDWDRIPIGESTKFSSSSNVVLLQRSSGFTPHTPSLAVLSGDAMAHTTVSNLNTAITTSEFSPSLPVQIISSSPADECLLREMSEMEVAKTPESIGKRSSRWPVWIAMISVIAAGVGAGYVFVLYSPYRLY